MRKNDKGFTLVELLAVIVILGLLMAIAIPSVTKYITQSRVKTLVSSIDSYVTAVVTQVNDGDYMFSDSTKVFAIPIECISLEKGGKSPFGNWMQANDAYWAYVLVHYDNENYNYQYGFTFKDDAGYGMYPTLNGKITNSLIKTGYDDLSQPNDGLAKNFVPISKWEGFTNLTDSTELVVLEAESDGVEGDGENTCTLCQRGDNYEEVEQEKTSNGNKYIVLNNNNQYILLNDIENEMTIDFYENNVLTSTINTENISFSNNIFVVNNSGDYDGTYKICADGYLEKNGNVIAKSEKKWVTRNDVMFLVIHNRVVYISSDGNTLDEEYFSLDIVKPMIEESLYGEDGIEAWGGSFYKFASFDGDNIKLENIYDFLALENFSNHCHSLGHVLTWLSSGEYSYWGGTAIDSKEGNAFVSNATWNSSKVTHRQELVLYFIDNNKKTSLSLNDYINDGVYTAFYTEDYYSYKGTKTSNIFYVDDYPFAYEVGMSYRDWINSEYSNSTSLNDYSGDYTVYIPVENLDKKISKGEHQGYGVMAFAHMEAYDESFGDSNMISFVYCSGEIVLPTISKADYSKYGYNSSNYEFVGWRYDGGIISNTVQSYDILSYYINNGLITNGSVSIMLLPVFKKINSDLEIDISNYLYKKENSNQIVDFRFDEFVADFNILSQYITTVGQTTALSGYTNYDYVWFSNGTIYCSNICKNTYKAIKSGNTIYVEFYFRGQLYKGEYQL